MWWRGPLRSSGELGADRAVGEFGGVDVHVERLLPARDRLDGRARRGDAALGLAVLRRGQGDDDRSGDARRTLVDVGRGDLREVARGELEADLVPLGIDGDAGGAVAVGRPGPGRLGRTGQAHAEDDLPARRGVRRAAAAGVVASARTGDE